ncbi:IPT/TIG domain-containing protein [Peptoclostridium acidaminophilum]|nr:IPT/TIG domain-containing protein [Peptoclostridium acidaminophilum]
MTNARWRASKLVRRLTAILLSLLMALGSMPWSEMERAYAYDKSKYSVDSVLITKVHEGGLYKVTKTKITIMGSYLKDITVKSITSQGADVYSRAQINEEEIVQFEIPGSIGSSIIVGDCQISIDQEGLPAMSGMLDRIIVTGSEGISITGTGLDKVGTTYNGASISGAFEDKSGAVAQTPLPVSAKTEGSLSTNPINGNLGLQNIVFKKEYTQQVDFESGTSQVKTTIQNTYNDQFRLTKKMDVKDAAMNPNRGQFGDEIIITASSGLDVNNVDVFLLKSITDKYTNDSKCPFLGSNPDADRKQMLTVKVPKDKKGVIENGEYYVVITNKIPDGADPDKSVDEQFEFGEDQKFTIIDASQKMKIYQPLSPESGPDTGSRTEISGVYIGSLNIGFTPDTPGHMSVDAKDSGEVLTVDYGTGKYKGEAVSVKKEVKVLIGGLAKFAKKADSSDYDFSFNSSMDKVKVITQQVTDAEESPHKDVVIETRTIITKLPVEDSENPNVTIIKDRAELKGGYTFEPSTITPSNLGMTPPKIHVESDGSGGYVTTKDILISITGRNFIVHRYTDASDKQVKVKYPIVELGSELRLSKNTYVGAESDVDPQRLELKVLDKNDNEIDGSTPGQTGDRIVAVIPSGTRLSRLVLGKADLVVINPMRDDSSVEGKRGVLPYGIEFVSPPSAKVPIIESVTPDSVMKEGGETVTVTGSNFQDGLRVYIDGKEIKTFERRQDGTSIIFKAPQGREGLTQLQIMNAEGGVDTAEFRFVKTYTNPKIASFSPGMGSGDDEQRGIEPTLVVISGQNFLLPDSSGSREYIHKLIGARVLLGGKDINSYNRDSKGKIILSPFAAPEGEYVIGLDASGKRPVLADYYHSVVLENEDAENEFMVLSVNEKGEISLSGPRKSFDIIASGAEIKAVDRDGNEYTLSYPGSDKVELSCSGRETLKLKMMTPFAIGADGRIYGDRVRVKDMNTIYFWVPGKSHPDFRDLPSNYYDISVINPDTKKDTKSGQSGFYLITTPNHEQNPSVEEGGLQPSFGLIAGGYTVKITGKGFTPQTRVFVDGAEARVSSVNNGGTQMEIIVPPYGKKQGDMTSQKAKVPVVILNPGGASWSSSIDSEYFTYYAPFSTPVISNLQPAAEGTTLGGDTVRIDVSDIRTSQDEQGNRILPKVYFGSKEVQLQEDNIFNGYIKLKTPPNPAGTVDVIFVNQGENSYGMSNKLKFTYRISPTSIRTVLPAVGDKAGNESVELIGTGFGETQISLAASLVQGDSPAAFERMTMPLVRFGDVSNKGRAGTGEIENAKAFVELEGGLSAEYSESQALVRLSIKTIDAEYSGTVDGYSGETIFVPAGLLKDATGEGYFGKELIRVEVLSDRLIVERGYAPYARLVNSEFIELTTPSYFSAVKIPVRVSVTVMNPDGGTAKSEFEYRNPDSKPAIETILKDSRDPEQVTHSFSGIPKDIRLVKLSIAGGNTIAIKGSDFREGASVQIADLPAIKAEQLRDQSPELIVFDMPAVPQSYIGRLCKVKVINADGGIASSDSSQPPIYIQFIGGDSVPRLDAITPNIGSSSGGDWVTITGDDFRDGLIVMFGGTQAAEVTRVDYKTIKVKTPAHVPGKADVKVENSDGEIAVLRNGFTFVSGPAIDCVLKSSDMKTSMDSLSAYGGESIAVKGKGFMQGARVVFMPELTDSQTPALYIGSKGYVIKAGADAKAVEWKDENTLIVTTPEGVMGKQGMIVINPDGGATAVYRISYGLPNVDAPSDVEAEIIYDRYISVKWSAVEGAKGYDVYAIEGGREYLVHSTSNTSFIYQDVKSNTSYRFKIKALGAVSSSKASRESDRVATGKNAGYEDSDSGLGEKTQMSIAGSAACITMGEEDADRPLNIDLTSGRLSGAESAVISMSSQVIRDSGAADISVIGRDFTLTFNPNAFDVSGIDSSSGSGVRIEIAKAKVPSGSQDGSVSAEYTIKAYAYSKSGQKQLYYMAEPARLELGIDSAKLSMRRYKSAGLSLYDETQRVWKSVEGGASHFDSVSGRISGLGSYRATGTR